MTDEELKELVAKNSQDISDNNKGFFELRKSQQQTDRMITRIGKQIGDIGNKFGRYTEGLFYPSLEKILTKDFGLENLAYRYKAKRNGDNMELDMLGFSNSGENKAVVVEIKSQLRDDDIDELIKTLKLFPKFFPQHKGKKLFGIIAAVGISDEQKRRAEKLGVYVVKISDETFKLVSKKDFTPKNFAQTDK